MKHGIAGVALVVWVAASGARGANLEIFAGSGTNASGPAAECRLADPFAIDFDRSGNAYICEMTNNRVVKIDPAGRLSRFAGTTRKGSDGDGGPAANAQLNGPHHLLVDFDGNLLIADAFNWKIRRVDAKTGTISTFAGTGERGYRGDGGPARDAQFSGVYCLAFDRQGQSLYVADLENRRVRVIDLKSGNVRTFAGNGQRGVPADGAVASEAPLFDPRAVAVDQHDRVYILERGGHALRVVENGRIRTVAGTGKAGPLTSATAPLEVTLRGPKHLCIESDGSVLIVDSENDAIRRFRPGADRMEAVLGTGRRGAALNPNPLQTELHHPHGVNVDRGGRIYVCDSYNGRVLVMPQK